MPASSIFSFSQIALTATLAFAASLLLLFSSSRRSGAFTVNEMLTIGFVVGASVLFWRLAGNVSTLNDDPFLFFSPNDLLCPMVTFVSLGLYAAFHQPTDAARWERTRAWLTLISFVVNVVFI